jgi:hypothetical protein
MPNELPDGTVIPSHLMVEDDHYDEDQTQSQFGLKMGTVTAIYYPEDKRNFRKNKIEYDVEVKERTGSHGFVVSTYRRCITSDMFGGLADFVEYTHRPTEEKPDKNKLDPIYNDGSTVLLMCLYGDSNQAYIVGGMRKPNHPKTSAADRGHFLEFEFNGVNIEINKDGEMLLTWKSRTDIKGAPQDEEAGGTYVWIDKTGSIELNDNKNMQIRMDKPTADITIRTNERDIIMHAERDLNVTTNRDINAECKRNANVTVGNNLTGLVKGQADLTVQKDTNIVVKGKTTLTSTGKIDAKTDSDAFITAKGRAKVKAPLIELTDSSTSGTDGIITGASIDPFTGVPHIDFSTISRAKK